MGLYRHPSTLEAALAALAAEPLTPLAGGTDLFPAAAAAQTWGRPGPDAILDLSRIDTLRGITLDGAAMRIGALTTWTEIATAPLPPALAALQCAARAVGGPQVQNRGTLVGNLCNASPAADGVPCLLALDAEVELASVRAVRSMPLADFLRGNRRTARAPDELMTAIHVELPDGPVASAFEKLGARAHLVISIVMVAAELRVVDDRITRARVAIGACSAVATRLARLEAELVGSELHAAADRVSARHVASLTPIDDARGTAAYRRDAAVTLVQRALARAAERLRPSGRRERAA